MIPIKVKENLDEYIYQEIYVQIAVIKGKEKGTTKSAIIKYFNSNHFKDLSNGRPYDHFINRLKEKCLGKLIDSPMVGKITDDEEIKELQKKINQLNVNELNNTYWEIETGEYLSGEQIKEIENERDKLIKKFNIKKKNNKVDEAYEAIFDFCKKYEELCIKKYPEAPLPLQISKSFN